MRPKITPDLYRINMVLNIVALRRYNPKRFKALLTKSSHKLIFLALSNH
jgi:hypothetical protein